MALSPIPRASAGATALYSVNAADYGVVGNGTTDDTAAMQAAITATPDGGTLVASAAYYKLTAPLVINKNMTLMGAGVTQKCGPISNSESINMPVVAPYLAGTVFCQTASNMDAIQIASTTPGLTVNLKDFGIFFGTLTSGLPSSPAFTSTGHGIHVNPPASGGGKDNGVMRGDWSNLIVMGHDGSHYAYSLTNCILMNLRNLTHYGGGGLLLENNGATFYGNSLIDNYYGQTFVGGTAHGIYLKSTLNALNLIQFNRPQVTCDSTIKSNSVFASLASATTLSTSQLCFNADAWSGNQYGTNAGVQNVTLMAWDFETAGTASNPSFVFPTGPGTFIDPSGIGAGYNDGLGTPLKLSIPSAGFPLIWSQYTPYLDSRFQVFPAPRLPVYPGPNKTPRLPPGAVGTGGYILDSTAHTIVASGDGIGWSDTDAATTLASLNTTASGFPGGSIALDLNFSDAGFGTGAVSTFTPSSVSDGQGSTGVGGVLTANSTGTKPNWDASTSQPMSATAQKKGVYFNGGAAYFTIATTQGPTNAFTDFYIIYPTDYSYYQSNFGTPLGNANGVGFQVSLGNANASPFTTLPGGLIIANRTTNAYVCGSGTYVVPMEQWYMVAVVYDGANSLCSYRVNSTNFGTSSGSGFITGSATATAGLMEVGGFNTSNSGAFKGWIGRIVRYNIVLSANQILSVEKYLRAWTGGGV